MSSKVCLLYLGLPARLTPPEIIVESCAIFQKDSRQLVLQIHNADPDPIEFNASD